MLPVNYCPTLSAGASASKNFLLLLPGMLLSAVIVVVGAILMPESHAWSGYQDPEVCTARALLHLVTAVGGGWPTWGGLVA